jgi:UDP-hydrolysing UDP-N-acetyl-D-glucosamine 2-epimerase
LSDRPKIAFLSTGRQDYGILRSTLALLGSEKRISTQLWIGGMHVAAGFGRTGNAVRSEALAPVREFRMDPVDQAPSAVASLTLHEVSAAISDEGPQALFLVGDRFETLAAAMAATLARLPIVHLHGGEETEGAMDNVMRHAITKLSHLHLVSHETHARRVRQMGEPEANVVVVGAPGLDHLHRTDLPDRMELSRRLDRKLPDPVVLVTMHPETLGGDPRLQAEVLVAALDRVSACYVVTAPNMDEGGREIRGVFDAWAARRTNVILAESLGERLYWGMLRLASAMVGNSSSGIIEAPAAGVPVVNVGDRQRGRLRFGVVFDVPIDADSIERAVMRALSANSRRAASTAEVPYPTGSAAARIRAALLEWLPSATARKPFRDRLCAELS